MNEKRAKMNWKKRGVFALIGVAVALVIALAGGVYLATNNSLTGASIGIESVFSCNVSVRDSVSNIGHDYYCTNSHGFIIDADNIVFDCQNHIIQCSSGCGNGSLAGVWVEPGRTNVVVKNCNISNFDMGVRIDPNATNTQVVDSYFKNNTQGVYINNGTNSSIHGSIFFNNTACGVNITNIGNNPASSTRNNYIWNNKFLNGTATTKNACEDTVSYNFWYYNRTCPSTIYPGTSSTYEALGYSTTNIIGGPCLGGNYWEDYGGMDNDGDRLGDTQVPHQGGGILDAHVGDLYPLVYLNVPGVVCVLQTMTENLTSPANSGEGISIVCSNATLNCNGFSLIGTGANATDMRGIEIVNVNNVEIKNCDISKFTYGIFIQSSSNVTLTNLTIHDNNLTGVYLGSLVTNVTLQNSTLYALNGVWQQFGVHLQTAKPGGGDNIIISNTFRNQSTAAIYLSDASEGNTISSNIIHNNNQGIWIASSDSNSIYNNRVYNNTNEGIKVISSTLSDLGGSNNVASCTNGCDGVHTDCVNSCSSEYTSCNSQCTTNASTCNTTCNNNYNTMVNSCISNKTTSLTSCTSTYQTCHSVCLGYNQSTPQYVQCEYICLDVNYTNCNNTATSTYDTCLTSASTNYGTSCTSACSIATCQNNCETSYGTSCTTSCDSDYSSCPTECNSTYNYNQVFGNRYGYFLDAAHSSSSYGITGEVYNNSFGLYQYDSDVNIRGATIYNNPLGNVLLNRSNNVFLDADLFGGSYGIYATGVNGLTLGNYSDVEIYNNSYGVYLFNTNTSGATPYGTNVIIHNNTINVLLNNSILNQFEGVQVYGGAYGFVLNSSRNNTLKSNTIHNITTYYLYLNESYNNTIYDNYIDNSTGGRDGYDDGSNLWNISKTLALNIIGGPYLGGNFWSGYTGLDVDNDGLGDTSYSLLPNSILDNSPLKAANISCGTIGNSITLSRNLTPSSVNCLVVNNNNLTIDCGGYYIIGTGIGVNGTAINITGKTGTIVKNCKLYNFTYGMYLSSANSTTLFNSTINNNTYGVFSVLSTSRVNLSNNYFMYNNYSIYSTSLANSSVLSNSFGSDVQDNIYLIYSNSSTLNNNVFSGTGITGIHLLRSYNNTLTSNTLQGKSFGINLSASSSNFVYNNLFDNTNDAVDNGTNFYNTSYSCNGASNLLGGTCMGGNFWHNYNGIDDGSGNSTPLNISNDGIGDTVLPFNDSNRISTGGDYLPLVVHCGNVTSNLILAQNLTYNGTCFSLLSDGITLDCVGHSITGNGTDNGVYINGKNNVKITNCTLLNFTNGIYGYNSNNITLNNNILSQDQKGIYFNQVKNASVYLNSIYSTTYGLYISSISSQNVLYNNSIYNNSYGVYFATYATDNNLTTNWIYQNSLRGVYFNTSAGNRIFNNNFTNTYNAYADPQSNNTWNVSYSCTAGYSNILGGNCTGGNFWNDYAGTDSGLNAYPYNNPNDGIGDTQIPYSTGLSFGGDYLPYTSLNGTVGGTLCPITITKDTKIDQTINCSSGGNGLVVVADGITLDCDGHLLVGDGTGSGIYVGSRNGVIIKNCNISNFYYGINVQDSSNIRINGSNNIYNNDFYAIYQFNSQNTTIVDNTLTNDNNGIYSISSTDTIIRDNTINLQKKFYGIYGFNSPGSEIYGNTLWDNYHGIYLVNSRGANVTSNNITGSDVYSLFVNKNTSNSIFYHNTLSAATEAIRIKDNSNYNYFLNNTLTGHTSYGIYSTTSSYNNFTNNTLYNNTANVYLSGSLANRFVNNSITGGSNGVQVVSSSNSLYLERNIINSSLSPGTVINDSSSVTLHNNTLYTSLSLNTVPSSIFSYNYISQNLTLADSPNVRINDNNLTFMVEIRGSDSFNLSSNDMINVTVSTSSGSAVADNTFSYLSVNGFTSGTISGNNVNNILGTAFDLLGVSSSQIYSNTIQNTTYGLSLRSSSNLNDLYSNWIRSNVVGINISSSTSNVLYNNYLENTKNVVDDSSNSWNYTYNCVTPNIVGGPCQGGNFYSDYYGLDNGENDGDQGDGVGDQPNYYTVSGSTRDNLPLVLFVARQYFKPDAGVAATMSANSNVSGALVDGSVVPNQVQLINYTLAGNAYVELTGLFNQSNVDTSNLKVNLNANKTALNKSGVSNLGSAYNLYVYHNYGLDKGVYLCPDLYDVNYANETCLGRINFTSIGTVAGINFSSSGPYYKLSNVTNTSSVLVLNSADVCGASILYSYTFTNNINCNTSTSALNVLADGITIDFNGYTLKGNNSGIGLNLVNRTGIVIKNANIQNFSTGIYVDPSSGINITHSNITNNTIGVQFILTNNSFLSNNYFRGNGLGLNLSQSYNNSIFNNYFNNTVNVRDEGTNNWNITAGSASNILGIAAYGGNYWSDYEGWDVDVDGYGENYYYNLTNSSGGVKGTDYLPLTELGKISCGNVTTNVTLGKTVNATGDCFTFTSDNLKFNCGGWTISGNASGAAFIANGRTGLNLTNCYVQNFTLGVQLNNTNSSLISSMVIYNNSYGINITRGYNNNISSNQIYRNTYGYESVSSGNNTLRNNLFYLNTLGNVRLSYTNYTNLTTNTFNGTVTSVWISNSYNNTLTNSSITNSTIGINLTSATYNLIYNNHFNNTNNAVADGLNLWNLSYSCNSSYRNVIGGNCSGGNYWSNYAGLDNESATGVYNVTPWNVTADGVGNTLIPYNNSNNITAGGDYLPLTGAVNLSGSSCTTVAATCSATGISCPGNVVVALVTCSAGQTCSAGVCSTPGSSSSSGGGGGGGGSSSSVKVQNITSVSCTQSWQCGAWNSCQQSRQTRVCYDSNDCSYKKSLDQVDTIITQTRPSESRSCTGEVEVIYTPSVPSTPSGGFSQVIEDILPQPLTDPGITRTITLSSLAAAALFGGIYSYWYLAAPVNRLRRKLKKTTPVLAEANTELLKEHYLGAYNLYMKLSEKKKQNFYAHVTNLREEIEVQLKAEKKMDELIQKSTQAGFVDQKKIYLEMYNNYLKLPPAGQQKYYPGLVQLRERLERGAGK